MNHLDENVIASLFERRASATVIADIDAHVASCEPCRDFLATYAELFESPGTLGPTVATPPPRMGTEVLVPDGPPPLTPSILEWIDRHGPRQRIGKVLRDKWTLDALLGSGGMGHVYAATHRNGRRGAVKMLRPELAANPDVVERFLREGYVANRIGHPGTVAILDDDCTEDGAPFLVMELLEGETFGERLHRAGRLPVADVLAITDQVLDVLAVAHQQGIVHRDLKPDNLFITREEKLKVLDFGIARILETSRSGPGTQTGAMMGTPQYMPPEQARGEWDAVDGRTDLWALGATMYACVTGLPVRDAETPNLALLMAMTEPVRKVREVAPWVSVATAQVIDRALSLNRDDRFANAEEMQRAVRYAARMPSGADVEPLPAPVAPAPSAEILSRRVGFEPPRSSSRTWLAALAVATLGAGAASIFFFGDLVVRPRAARVEPAAAALVSAPPEIASSAAHPLEPIAVVAPATASIAAPLAASVRPTPRGLSRAAPAKSSAPSTAVSAVASAKPPPTEVNPLDVRR